MLIQDMQIQFKQKLQKSDEGEKEGAKRESYANSFAPLSLLPFPSPLSLPFHRDTCSRDGMVPMLEWHPTQRKKTLKKCI
jgi:hypothetical protein